MANYKQIKEIKERTEAIDVFISMGGNPSCSNEIETSKLITIIKNFELTIDVEKLIKEIDINSNGLLDFEELRDMLKQ